MIAFNVTLKQLALVVASLSAVACGRVPGQFEVLNNALPNDSCGVDVDPTVYRGSGVLDLSLVSPGAESAYLMYPLFQNNLESSTGGGIDANAIHLRSFAVDITPLGPLPPLTQELFSTLEGDAAGSKLLHYSAPWSGSVSSGGGMIATIVKGFPVGLANQIFGVGEIGLSPSVTMNIRIRGFGSTTTRDIESDPFDFPVALCDGCLIANLQPCPYTVAPAHSGNRCNVAQDQSVDCCLNGNDLICPPSVVGH
jgi:hypothetical protein